MFPSIVGVGGERRQTYCEFDVVGSSDCALLCCVVLLAGMGCCGIVLLACVDCCGNRYRNALSELGADVIAAYVSLWFAGTPKSQHTVSHPPKRSFFQPAANLWLHISGIRSFSIRVLQGRFSCATSERQRTMT